MDSLFAQHALFAGFAGLLMIAVLPGLAIFKAGIYANGWLAIPVILSVSLVANFQLAFYLVLVGAYRVESLASAFIALVAWIGWPKEKVLTKDTLTLPASDHLSVSLTVRWLGLAVALASIFPLAKSMISEVPGVFSAWDAVVSWNRWAQDWYQGHLPSNTYGYPQLVPSAWASTYVWLGSAQIELWAKGLMALFPLAVIAIFADMHLRFRSAAALFAVAIWSVALMARFPELIDSGYVDVPVSFFILLTAYLLLLVQKKHLSEPHGLTLAAIAAAGAVLTKQSGWLAAFIFFAGLLNARVKQDAQRAWNVKWALWIFLCLVGPWLVYKYYQLWNAVDPSNVAYVTSNIYAGESAPDRLIRAITVNTPSLFNAVVPTVWRWPVLLVVAASAVAAVRDSLGRMCLLAIVLPYYFVWALFFSYDMRNLMPAIPFAALGMGIGMAGIGEGIMARFRQVAPGSAFTLPNWGRIRLSPSPAIVLFLIPLSSTLLFPISRNDLVMVNNTLRQSSGDPLLNSYLIEYGRAVGFQGKILSTYTPVASIEGLKAHFFSDPEHPSPTVALISALKNVTPFCQLIVLIPRHPELRYLLLHRPVYAEMVDKGIENGSLRLLHETLTIRFLEISCPPDPTTLSN